MFLPFLRIYKKFPPHGDFYIRQSKQQPVSGCLSVRKLLEEKTASFRQLLYCKNRACFLLYFYCNRPRLFPPFWFHIVFCFFIICVSELFGNPFLTKFYEFYFNLAVLRKYSILSGIIFLYPLFSPVFFCFIWLLQRKQEQSRPVLHGNRSPVRCGLSWFFQCRTFLLSSAPAPKPRLNNPRG